MMEKSTEPVEVLALALPAPQMDVAIAMLCVAELKMQNDPNTALAQMVAVLVQNRLSPAELDNLRVTIANLRKRAITSQLKRMGRNGTPDEVAEMAEAVNKLYSFGFHE